MEEFPYYTLSWFFYLLFAVIFLLLSTWKSRSWSPWLRIPVLTFIAAMAFTPGITLSGESYWSPAAIIMIFELDQKGFVGIFRGAISIITVWLLLMISTIIIRWKFSKNKSKNTTESDGNIKPIELKDPDS